MVNPKLSVIIPVYNEKDTIKEVIKKVKEINISKEIILVDDFSKDGTREFLKKLKDKEVKVIFHEKNHGKGYAIRTAISKVSGEVVIIQDADLEYDPKDYLKLIKPILEGHAKVVYGTRFPKGHNKTSIFKNKHYLANKILTLTANLLYNAKITDEATCYKVFDAELLKNITLKCNRFEFCPEVTAKVRKKGHKIMELSISYYPRTEKQGKKIKTRDGFEAMWALVKYRFVN